MPVVMKLKCSRGTFSRLVQGLVWVQIGVLLLLLYYKDMVAWILEAHYMLRSYHVIKTFVPDQKMKKLGLQYWMMVCRQHLNLLRDVEVVMLNGLMPWGNGYLLPRGPLREPLSALARADIVVIHHADLASNTQLNFIESTVQKISATLPIFFSRLAPSYVFEARNDQFKLPLSLVHNTVLLCVSAIGFPDALTQGIMKIGPFHVDRLDFSDHHFINSNDIEMIKERLKELEDRFEVKPRVLVTEKDYDRDPEILRELDEVLVLCCSFQIMTFKDHTNESFVEKLKELLINRCRDKDTQTT